VDLVLALLGREQIVGIDVLQTNENPRDPSLRGFLDKVRGAVAQGIHLSREASPQALANPQLDHPIKKRFLVAIAREIIIGDEEPPIARR
jgi:hypothetical protein